MCVRSVPSKISAGEAAEILGTTGKVSRPGGRRAGGPPPPSFHERRISTAKGTAGVKASQDTTILSQLMIILRVTTQPFHVVAMVAVLVVSAVFFPWKGDEEELDTKARQLLGLLHLTAFATQFGSQIWMTFASGLSLYFSMPRHIFGQIQKVLFPLYFTLTGALSLVTIFTYSQLHPVQNNGPTQMVAMCACFITQLFARLCLCPPLIRFMETKHKMESMASSGDITKCPRYMQYSISFRRTHSATALCNIFTMACTTFHLHHLAQQFCI
ncbi:transmembrane protein 205 [Ischnura elegans]|uniref:transmembrane protein 205 n=1 Tax=Ischnura elegans TaxID=197161 RepID=UPI001ED877B2|nr:transmembrane protein 205 [Ischnura elegans]